MNRTARWAEFAALYLGAPLAIALFLPPRQMFPALFGFTLFGLLLLWRTGGFDWRQLVRGWSRFDLRLAVAFAALVALTSIAVMVLTRPEALFSFARHRPGLLMLVWVLYPLLSALPQELIFRALFFHRYGTLMRDRRHAILMNAAVFSFAHLMYWSWIVAAFTFMGGVAFATAYLRRGFPWAWALHALAGNILFAVGMGLYFYSGNVQRPF